MIMFGIIQGLYIVREDEEAEREENAEKNYSMRRTQKEEKGN